MKDNKKKGKKKTTQSSQKKGFVIKDKIAEMAKDSVDSVKNTTDKIGEGFKNTADKTKSTLHIGETEKLDKSLDEAIKNYNKTYAKLDKCGSELFKEREICVELIEDVEDLINTIANNPKEFKTELSEIKFHKSKFKSVYEFAKEEANIDRGASVGSGAGVAGGVAVASLAPATAMWVATTFGTASTGAAISSLSGAAATNAALAWLGGGALATGGGGMALGNAFLAMAGPIGWTIAGASIATATGLAINKKLKLNEEKKKEIERINKNTDSLKKSISKINNLCKKTNTLRKATKAKYRDCLESRNRDFLSLTYEQQMKLGALVNETNSLSKLLTKTI